MVEISMIFCFVFAIAILYTQIYKKEKNYVWRIKNSKYCIYTPGMIFLISLCSIIFIELIKYFKINNALLNEKKKSGKINIRAIYYY